MQGPDIEPSYFLGLLLWLLIGWLIGYWRGREDGRAAERRDVRFTPVDEPVDKIEPRGYHPPLADADPRWEAEKKQNHGPTLQGYTPGGDAYRHYEIDEL